MILSLQLVVPDASSRAQASTLGLLVVLVAAALPACDSDAAGSPPAGVIPGSEACRVAVVSSDYASTSISLLAADGTLCADDVLNSGSRPPGVVTSLSGDVVIPSTRHPRGLVTLIDRFPNAIVTFLDAATHAVVGQIPVATGFPSNPHDVAFVSETKAYVTRHETNPDPSLDPAALDGGGDLLIVDPDALTVTGRVDLLTEVGRAAGERLDARPDRVAVVSDQVWVSLNHLSRDFTRGGPGIVLAIDPEADAIARRVDLPEQANCGTLAPTLDDAGEPDGLGLWVACTGVYQEGEAAQLARSAVAYVDLTGAEPALAWVGPAAALALAPFGSGLVAAGPQRAVVTVLGRLDPPEPDRLFLVDRSAGSAEALDVTTDAFELGALALLAAGGVLLAADSDPEAPQVLRLAWDRDAGPGAALPPIAANPKVGLEPRSLGVFR